MKGMLVGLWGDLAMRYEGDEGASYVAVLLGRALRVGGTEIAEARV
jgi:hypothetical protein